MSEFTPSTGAVEEAYVQIGIWDEGKARSVYRAEFRRWLDQVRAQARTEARREIFREAMYGT